MMSGDMESAVAGPHTECGQKISVDDASGPAGLFCHRWHPTHATITVGSKTYDWHSRAHRKLRFVEASGDEAAKAEAGHPAELHARFRLLSWEPHIVTWHICWIGVVANTLWVVNGVYATWPDEARAFHEDPEAMSWWTGVVGAFLFIVTGYLGYVEALNQTYGRVQLPAANPQDGGEGKPPKPKRSFRRPRSFGEWVHPLGLAHAEHPRDGYATVPDVETKSLLPKDTAPDSHRYIWWMWRPDLHIMGIFNALVFFIATIIFFIPATVWYPMEERGASIESTLFWVYILQIIPSVGFVYVGHGAVAEASGSWWRPDFNNIGWWISVFNTVGGYGFLLCPILAIPSVVGEPGCCDNLAKWGGDLATFWGSCAFWVAGILQCIEFSSQHPINFNK